MGVVRGKVQLESIGITKPPKVRRTATGALSLEISGQDNGMKADALAAKMSEALSGKEGVRVGRPLMTADLRIHGFEESVTEEEIKEALAKASNLFSLTFTVGPIRKQADGLCTTLVKCPLAVANALAREGGGVVMLEKWPLQCYKCLELGHTRSTCHSDVDRTGAYYRCGNTGHPARECLAPVSCAVCQSKGMPHNHRVGGPICKGSKKRKGGGKTAEKQGPVTKPTSQAPTAGEGAESKTKPKSTKPKVVDNLTVKGFQVTQGGSFRRG
ncbi:hypothetical protein DBV15_12612 [Temnothorax longispinosus]|uniref:CCHC-type domain-containing protein n=1 Tax=Temnothorax longispinosus TaxID=300112 RepID=A0A4S2KP66_9HYME|nr:hypothetical protein DBV15_12612 [Temnothorax longispinosus]